MELRHKNYDTALNLLQSACNVPRIRKVSGDDPVQKRLFKSTKLWAFHADLEESLGTFTSTKAVYDTILELRIATPQLIINYATYLEEHKHFEESFKAYEKGALVVLLACANIIKAFRCSNTLMYSISGWLI
jgi:pre-mRNA-splicing factor SYF1